MSASAQRPDRAGTVYHRPGATRPRLPRDPLMWGAALVGVAGLLLGGFFVLGGPGGGGTPAVPAVAATGSTGTSTPAAQEPSAPPTVGTSSPTSTPSTAPAQPTGPTVFRQVASGRCLGIDGDGAQATAKLLDCRGDDSRQRWLPKSIGSGLVALVNQASNMCLDVEGANADDGARLQQYPCHGEANQQWRLVPTAGGPVLIAALHSGRCAYPDAGRPDAGTEIRQTTCVDTPDQQWQLG
ncbi:RICIN domain-containing protein [Salinispora tropica]|uniref:Ricin B lectin n=1 Tax=Salinispora tropica (strain ATCC BAA-916 / DSM 44818 / JCM 13857 / NBRC 105044 / CNB-440) TaxID=369723 RepID=A4X3U6_SALTO|nr:RICIN domain-containing protein [Salinispora tropica]ABP53546.1 Ricin B lectin [Salinispora tropica CNB-440]